MKKESTKKSILWTLFMAILALIILEILTSLTLNGAALLSTIVYAIFDSKLLSIISIVIVFFIGGGAIISAFIYMALQTSGSSPNKWFSSILGLLIIGIYLYLAISTHVPADPTDNFIDIPIFIYDIPVIIYGLLTVGFSLSSKNTDDD